jgi:pseudaminic acid biosynthesis-associated methylase
MKFQTPQEEFWSGSFGDEYIDRNQSTQIVAANIALFSKVLSRTSNIQSVIEFGSNIGLNLIAIKQLLPEAELSAIEINDKAVSILKKRDHIKKIYHQSILDFDCDYPREFVFTKGVLIHINPDVLSRVYDKLHNASQRYICIADSSNPVPQQVNYRGQTEKLFKRYFAGELLDRFSDLRLIDYGFVYHRDAHFSLDDISWFLFEKTLTRDE